MRKPIEVEVVEVTRHVASMSDAGGDLSRHERVIHYLAQENESLRQALTLAEKDAAQISINLRAWLSAARKDAA